MVCSSRSFARTFVEVGGWRGRVEPSVKLLTSTLHGAAVQGGTGLAKADGGRSVAMGSGNLGCLLGLVPGQPGGSSGAIGIARACRSWPRRA